MSQELRVKSQESQYSHEGIFMPHVSYLMPLLLKGVL